jgi:hypothetical protein
MKRFLQVLLAFLALSCAGAQNSYFGLRLAYTPIDFFGTQLPLFGFQLGVPVANNLAFRGTLDTIVLLSFAQVDLLYSVGLSSDLSGYIGGGPDVTFVDMFRYPSAAVHGTAGLEYRTGSVGFFAEAQPILPLPDLQNPLFKLGAGVNFHF